MTMDFIDLVRIGFRTAWSFAPFPFRIIGLIVLVRLWLYVEYHVTSYARQLPGWRRPLPGLGFLSEVAVWVERVSKWLLFVWFLVFFTLASGQMIVLAGGQDALWLVPILQAIGDVWHRFYSLLGLLGVKQVRRLLPE